MPLSRTLTEAAMKYIALTIVLVVSGCSDPSKAAPPVAPATTSVTPSDATAAVRPTEPDAIEALFRNLHATSPVLAPPSAAVSLADLEELRRERSVRLLDDYYRV